MADFLDKLFVYAATDLYMKTPGTQEEKWAAVQRGMFPFQDDPNNIPSNEAFENRMYNFGRWIRNYISEIRRGV